MPNQLPDNRPLAIMVPASRWDEVRGRYPHLIAKAEAVYEGPEMKILTMYPDSVRTYIHTRNRGVETERLTRSLVRQQNWQATRQTDQLTYISFDSLTPAKRVFQGKGAYSGTMSDTTWLLNSNLPKGLYTVSFWIYANQDQGMNHDLKIGENSATDGREIHYRHEGLRFHLKSIVDNWALYELGFEVHEDNARMRLFLHKENINQPFYLDELLIKPMDVEVYRREAEWVIRNNFWYHLD